MPKPNQAALDFLLSRRSRPWRTLAAPGPDHAALDRLLTAAARVPDHGKLEPWRFVVLENAALHRLADLTTDRGAALGLDPDKVAKTAAQFASSPLIVAVVLTPTASEKVPEIEQVLSAGAVCLSLLNAALAAGWGANWLSGFVAYDRAFLTDGLGLAATESIAGFIHIGTETCTPPERPRPDIAAKTEWVTL